MDHSKCVRCSICIKVCPSCEIDFDELNLKIFQELPKIFGWEIILTAIQDILKPMSYV